MDWGLARPRDGREPPAPALPRALREHHQPLGATEVVALERGAGVVAGTPAYLAPEQARGDLAALDHRCDVWGLGAILYEMLSGAPPFAGPSGEVIVAKVLRGELTPPSERAPERSIPWELEAVVLKAMRRRPEERYPDVAALRADVVSFLEGRTLGAARYAPWARLAKWARRHRVGLALALLAAAALGLAAWLVQDALARGRAVERAREEARAAAVVGSPAAALAACERGLALAPADDELLRMAWSRPSAPRAASPAAPRPGPASWRPSSPTSARGPTPPSGGPSWPRASSRARSTSSSGRWTAGPATPAPTAGWPTPAGPQATSLAPGPPSSRPWTSPPPRSGPSSRPGWPR